jgi:hypothetical protein
VLARLTDLLGKEGMFNWGLLVRSETSDEFK